MVLQSPVKGTLRNSTATAWASMLALSGQRAHGWLGAGVSYG